MSGDWIKMRVNLGDDPRVTVIADTLRLHRDAVIGKLYRLWAWADQHTTDGITPVKAKWADEFVGKIGFAAAMNTAGWLEIEADGTISFPDFEVHNGASAKARALDAKRKKDEREAREQAEREAAEAAKESAKCPVANRTESGQSPDEKRTREEKSREENKDLDQKQDQEQSRASATPAARKPPARQLAKNWELPDDWREWALTERPDWNETIALRVSLEFRDHWHGKGEARADWLATWRNWVRRESRARVTGPPKARPPTLAESRAANLANITGKANGRDLTSTAERVDSAPVRSLPIDVRQSDGDDVGSSGPGRLARGVG